MASKDYYSAYRYPAYTNFRVLQNKGAMGIFDPMNLVVKLDADIAASLATPGGGVHLANSSDPRTIPAAVNFHETVHWWQHAGTTSGLLCALAVPLQTHMNRTHLEAFGCNYKKPLFKFLEKRGPSLSNAMRDNLNIIVNNWMDVEFSYALLNYPENAQQVCSDKFFESLGHAIEIHLAETINLLAACFDYDFDVLPNIAEWKHAFRELSHRRVRNYYYGSPVIVPPLGMHSIVESQARFQELQFLYRAAGRKLTWNDFKTMGLLGPVYTRAFEIFLEATELEYPSNPMSPSVNLFMVLCDIALNPASGYPDDIMDYEHFIEDISPGIRFLRGAGIIRKSPHLKNCLVNLTKNEYQEVAAKICQQAQWKTPQQTAVAITDLWKGTDVLQELERESKNGKFQLGNMPVRFYYANHLNLMRDKSKNPEFFCWPAKHLVVERNQVVDLQQIRTLFTSHQPPFIAKSMDGKVEDNLIQIDNSDRRTRVASTFFRWQITYDIVRQWIARNGHFSFNYCWIDPRYTELDFRRLIKEDFHSLCGCDFEDIALC